MPRKRFAAAFGFAIGYSVVPYLMRFDHYWYSWHIT